MTEPSQIDLLQRFADQYRSGAQGGDLDADTAQALAQAIDALTAERDRLFSMWEDAAERAEIAERLLREAGADQAASVGESAEVLNFIGIRHPAAEPSPVERQGADQVGGAMTRGVNKLGSDRH